MAQSELFATPSPRIDPKRETMLRREFARIMDLPTPEGCRELSAADKQWAQDEFIKASQPRRPPQRSED